MKVEIELSMSRELTVKELARERECSPTAVVCDLVYKALEELHQQKYGETKSKERNNENE